MKVQGYEVPAKAESALLEWMRGKNGGWTFMNATEVLIRAGCNADYSERAADRILQRQRKAGLIKYVHGFWRKTAS